MNNNTTINTYCDEVSAREVARACLAKVIAARPVTAGRSLTFEDVRHYFQDAIDEAGNWAAYYLFYAMRNDGVDRSLAFNRACAAARAHSMLVDAMGNDTMA